MLSGILLRLVPVEATDLPAAASQRRVTPSFEGTAVAAARMLHDALLPPWPGRSVGELVSGPDDWDHAPACRTGYVAARVVGRMAAAAVSILRLPLSATIIALLLTSRAGIATPR